MDCHRCKYIRYDGFRYGRCSHPGHQDVKFIPRKHREEGAARPYSKLICKEFCLRKRCANCSHWVRGEYYRDGQTPAKKGYCSLGIVDRNEDCPKWELRRR